MFSFHALMNADEMSTAEQISKIVTDNVVFVEHQKKKGPGPKVNCFSCNKSPPNFDKLPFFLAPALHTVTMHLKQAL